VARPPKNGFDLYYTANGLDRKVSRELALAITRILDNELVSGAGPWGQTGFPKSPMKMPRLPRPTMKIVIGPKKTRG
jgi:hypothetical protein